MAVDLWPPACRTYQLNHPATEVLCADLRDAAVRSGIVDRFAGVRAHNVTPAGEPFVWPSQRILKKLTGLGRAAVQRRLDSLIERGVISLHFQGDGQDTSTYVLHFAASPRPAVGPAEPASC